jgi:dephospho-CoA kinase
MTADEPPWDELAELFDDTWYIECDVDVAMQRVYDRQVITVQSSIDRF